MCAAPDLLLGAVRGAVGDTTGYTYNQLGEIAALTRPDQTSVAAGYDQASNLTAVTEYGPPPSAPVLDSQSFGYDPAGNLNSYTDGRTSATRCTSSPTPPSCSGTGRTSSSSRSRR